MSPPAFDPAGEGWKPSRSGPFGDHAGPIWSRTEPDGPAFGLVTAAHHGNPLGIVHGGVLMTMADHAMGTAAFLAAGRRPQVTVQLDIQFIAAVEVGAFLVARPAVIRLTRSLVLVRASSFVGDRLVAACTGIWKLVARQPLARDGLTTT